MYCRGQVAEQFPGIPRRQVFENGLSTQAGFIHSFHYRWTSSCYSIVCKITTVDCEGNVEAPNLVHHYEDEISRDLSLGKTEHFMPLNFVYFVDCAAVGAGSVGTTN